MQPLVFTLYNILADDNVECLMLEMDNFAYATFLLTDLLIVLGILYFCYFAIMIVLKIGRKIFRSEKKDEFVYQHPPHRCQCMNNFAKLVDEIFCTIDEEEELALLRELVLRDPENEDLAYYYFMRLKNSINIGYGRGRFSPFQT